MGELILDFLSAVWAGLQPILDLIYNATLKHWVAGFGAAILGALFGFMGFRRGKRRGKFKAVAWSICGIFFGGWLGGMIDGLYPVVKACGLMGLNACMDWAGIAPASFLGLIFLAAALGGNDNNRNGK